MILYIDTTKNDQVTIIVKDNGAEVVAKSFFAPRQQAERLLPEIDKLLKNKKIKLKDLEKIEIENSGGSFTSLRIGITTANVLGYALGIPVIGISGKTKIIKSKNNRKFNIVEPIYNREPNITVKRNNGLD
ncbi:tRNA (adenosine(37)-N6)-threonylcarbamoyltransferase complex dimerization subunit type 1 TsaB [Patescibacteria group bacterium]|nr:tRNA (adenosine(37)-N6)-threonylcarbamoyltransferase complex dimerization subunit type 1 TsaB [Patescibacteria group bacterium]MBU0879722.1 tRNA (adenosine(37)-N6)-threonylcarbamoyltransferase complex dimerization subunit type 1 TsaB [Patescibacteria group bacterium]MBU0880283.1 tRNA (adenosine(37)-N6)-threonylcarbamoyltransferase complex dimerization subunit type 1 TsaB [Patescibacteria group bacterium]MBU2081619.1 tRNA (adenosine(37)-N6)-threonylcarbamoyltransferase complex dimerization sub